MFKWARRIILQDAAILMSDEKYKNHFIFKNEIFQSEIFHAYKSLVAEVLENYVIPEEVTLTNAMPALNSKLDANMSSIHQKLGLIIATSQKRSEMDESITSTLATEIQKIGQVFEKKADIISQKVEETMVNIPSKVMVSFGEALIFAGGATQPNLCSPLPTAIKPTVSAANNPWPADSPSVIDPTTSSTDINSAPSNENGTPESSLLSGGMAEKSKKIPKYEMSRKVDSVVDSWREYMTGLNNSDYSIETLENEFGAKWRSSEKEKKFFNRRLPIFNKIKSLTNAKCNGCREHPDYIKESMKIAHLLDADRITKKMKLNKYSEHLRDKAQLETDDV